MSAVTLDGAGLEKALAENKFDSAPATIAGMVKAAAKQGYISFARAGCDSWVDIPVAMIAEAERVGEQPCKDHSHPVFRLSLKEPADAQAKVLMALLASAPTVMPAGAMFPSPGGHPMMRAAPGGGQARAQCQTFCSGSTLWCMCPVYIPGIGMGYSVYPCGTCIDPPIYTAVASATNLFQTSF